MNHNGKNSLGWLAIGLSSLVLVVSLVMVFAYMRLPSPPPSISKPLAELIPTQVADWTVEAVPLASTPEMLGRVEEILQFDDAITLDYRYGNLLVEMYAAYWKAGKRDYDSTSVHNPDVCWINANWKCVERQSLKPKPVAGRLLQPLEYGVYEKAGVTQYVLFVHLVGGKSHSVNYEGFSKDFWPHVVWKLKRWYQIYITNFIAYGMQKPEDQLFVRISSNQPFESFWNTPRFETLVESWASLHLFEPGQLPANHP